MEYSNFGRVVLALVIVLSLLFLLRPRKSFFVYPLKSWQGKFFLCKSLIRAAALVGVVIWTFNFQRIDGSAPVHIPQHNIVFLLDGSLSMSSADVEPNRFKRATSLIASVVSGMSEAQSSLIVFSGLPVIRVPWTSDRSGFISLLSGMTLGDFPATDSFLGTALGDALLLSLQQFADLPAGAARAIVIISDGDSNKGYDPQKVLGVLKESHIPIYFVGIGTEGYEVGQDMTGLPVVTSFDEDIMQQFTEQTAGKIYLNPTQSDVGELISTLIAQSTKGEQIVYMSQRVMLNDLLTPFLFCGFILLLLMTLLQLLHTRPRRAVHK